MSAFVGLTGRVQAQPPEDGFFRAVKALPEIGWDRRRAGRSTDAAGSDHRLKYSEPSFRTGMRRARSRSRNSRYTFIFKVPPGNLIRTAIAPNPRCAMQRPRELPWRKCQGLIVDYFCGCFRGRFQNGPGAGSGSSIWRASGRTIRNAARPPDDEIVSKPPDRDLALLLAAAQLVLFLDLQCPARKPDPNCHAPSRTCSHGV